VVGICLEVIFFNRFICFCLPVFFAILFFTEFASRNNEASIFLFLVVQCFTCDPLWAFSLGYGEDGRKWSWRGLADTEASFSMVLFSVDLGVCCVAGLCAFGGVVASKEDKVWSSSSVSLESEGESSSLGVRDLLFSSAVF
jgi:hypothetical protein